MSDVTMLDAEPEPDDGTDDHVSPGPFKFLLSPEVWSLCQARPFRFLDLPAELRNRIYEQAFTGSHGLSPHHLTQVNRQIRAECFQMFHTETHTLQVTLQTPEQMTYFLNWVDDGAAGLSNSLPDFEFTYTDIDVGITTVHFAQVYHYPKMLYDMLMARVLGLSAQEATYYVWRFFTGLPYRHFLDDFGELIALHPPTPLFIEAIEKGFAWTYYKMHFVGELGEPLFPTTSVRAWEFFLYFIRLLTGMANKDWSPKALRDIAGFLFMRSMQAGPKVNREA
jgi:hypothetical protein